MFVGGLKNSGMKNPKNSSDKANGVATSFQDD
jgi:hypothetical protein